MKPLNSQHDPNVEHPEESGLPKDKPRKAASQHAEDHMNYAPVNEGEGSRSAARAYNEATERFVKAGRVDANAERAKEALEGGEKDELAQAEAAGKSRMHGEDPAIRQKPARR